MVRGIIYPHIIDIDEQLRAIGLPYAVLTLGISGRHLAKGEPPMPGPFDKMVCLVGENPLPVYLGIKQLATPEAEVVLVYSEATKPQAQNIKAILNLAKVTNGNRGRTCIMKQVVQLRDPYCPRQVRETLDAVVARLSNPRPYALNYTGGTKVMSDYGLLAWILMQQAPHQKERSTGLAWPEVKNAFYPRTRLRTPGVSPGVKASSRRLEAVFVRKFC
jgi:hypothetical protein